MGIWVGVFVTYVLSPIPVAFLFMKAGRFDLWPRVATVIYMPILWLAKRFDVVEKFYEWQARLIGLN